MSHQRKHVSLLVTDLDNTLFDWLGIWHASFSAMLEKLVQDSGVSRQTLEREFRTVHQKHGTVEYAFALGELPSLGLAPDDDPVIRFGAAIQAFREARRASMRLYPSVMETLAAVRKGGSKIVGYTESFAFYSAYRLRRLDLDLLLDALYSPADHDFPETLTPADIRTYPANHYDLRRTRHHHTPPGERKPNPDILCSIVESVGAELDATVYVGDSLMKDVMMAQDAGIADVWAKYGYSPERPEYELLKRVTHWTDADVRREKQLSSREVRPTYVLENSFSELLELFEFSPARHTRSSVG